MDFCVHNYVFVALYAYLLPQLWPQRKQYFKQAIPAQSQTTAPEMVHPNVIDRNWSSFEEKWSKGSKRWAVHGLGFIYSIFIR